MLVYLLERLYSLICRHEWIRERRADGSLGQRCMRCMRRRNYNLAQLVAWKPEYTPIQLSRDTEFPAPLTDRRAA
jgi:hypothetical protein